MQTKGKHFWGDPILPLIWGLLTYRCICRIGDGFNTALGEPVYGFLGLRYQEEQVSEASGRSVGFVCCPGACHAEAECPSPCWSGRGLRLLFASSAAVATLLHDKTLSFLGVQKSWSLSCLSLHLHSGVLDSPSHEGAPPGLVFPGIWFS